MMMMMMMMIIIIIIIIIMILMMMMIMMMMMMMTAMFMKIQIFWNVTICLTFEDNSTNTFRSAGNQSSDDRVAPPRKPKLSDLLSI